MPQPPSPPSDATLKERFAIDELSTLAGVTPRTVRFYIAQGLLDRPEGEKRGAHYIRKHLEQLLLIRRWTDAGLSLDRVRELLAGSLEDPAPQRTPPGSVEVWSRVTVADGVEVHLAPMRAGLSPEQARTLIRGIAELYRQVRDDDPAAQVGTFPAPTSSNNRENSND